MVGGPLAGGAENVLCVVHMKVYSFWVFFFFFLTCFFLNVKSSWILDGF